MGSYRKGQEVLRDEPFTHIVKSNMLTKVCDHCLQSTIDGTISGQVLTKCSECKIVSYCGETCQKKAWNSYHETECRLLQKSPFNLIPTGDVHDNYRNILRLILKASEDFDEKFAELPNGHKRYLKDLMSHKEDIENDTRMELFIHLYNLLQAAFESANLEDLLPSQPYVLELWGKLLVNQFDMMIQTETSHIPIGSGLYLACSYFDHSCAPNVTRISNGKQLILRTLDSVEDFSQLKISYISKLFERTSERRQRLKNCYYFLCECETCLDIEADQMKTSTKCSGCQGCVPIETKVCVNCDHVIDNPKLIEKYENVKILMRKMLTQPREDLKPYEFVFNEALNVIHVFDKDFMEFLQVVYVKERNAKHFAKCLEIMNLMLENYYQNHPKYHLNIGLSEMLAAKFCVCLNLMDETKVRIKKARSILQVTFGENHPIIKNLELKFAKFFTK